MTQEELRATLETYKETARLLGAEPRMCSPDNPHMGIEFDLGRVTVSLQPYLAHYKRDEYRTRIEFGTMAWSDEYGNYRRYRFVELDHATRKIDTPPEKLAAFIRKKADELLPFAEEEYLQGEELKAKHEQRERRAEKVQERLSRLTGKKWSGYLLNVYRGSRSRPWTIAFRLLAYLDMTRLDIEIKGATPEQAEAILEILNT